ncbi:MAG: tetratricopeptide repeat protein [Candidatus Kapabacteria bacterium]|nr:tetratricopeptide repeat protein [Candidatus Kapabacteria bacterium]
MTPEEIQNIMQLAKEEQNKGNLEKSIVILEKFYSSFQVSDTTDIDVVEQYIEAMLLLGWNYTISGKSAVAIKVITVALEYCIQFRLTLQSIKANIGLGNVFKRQNEFHIALEYYKKALFDSEKIEDKSGTATSLLHLAMTYRMISEYNLALEYSRKVLVLFQELNNKLEIAKTYQIIGTIYWEINDYQGSIEYFTKALFLNEEFENKRGVAITLANIGGVYFAISSYEKVLEYQVRALMLLEQMDDKEGIAGSKMNIGIVYLNLGDYEKALEYLFHALTINKEIGNEIGVVQTTENLGNVYFKLEKIEKANEYFTIALELFKENGNKSGIASTLSNLGNVNLKKRNFENAFNLFQESLSLYIEIGKKDGIARSSSSLGSIYSSKESQYYNTQQAESKLQQAIQLAEEIGSKELIKTSFEMLYSLRINEKRFEEAVEYQAKVIKLEKEIYSIEIKKQAERFDLERKTAEREKQIAIERARFVEKENVLKNILPESITDRIVKGENLIADHFESVSVLFLDLVGFTPLSSIAPPKHLVYFLDTIFTKADEIISKFGLEKIKTIGDGYLAVANVSIPLKNHQTVTAKAAIELNQIMNNFIIDIPIELGDSSWTNSINDIEIRIGIHTGEVVAGIIGKNKYTYDLWGDAVNVASRMESNSEAGRIHISEAFAKAIETNPEFILIPRGEINIKGKGRMNTFWLEKGK